MTGTCLNFYFLFLGETAYSVKHKGLGVSAPQPGTDMHLPGLDSGASPGPGIYPTPIN